MKQSERLEYIDLAKGICILLVVFMHIVPEIGKGNPLLINLRMPFYYFLSGMFFKSYDGFRNFIIKKSDRLLIPFIAWYLLSYLIYYVRVFFIGHPEHVFKLTDLFLEPEFYNGSIWFLLSLFWCNIIYYFIENVTKNPLLKASLVLGIGVIGGMFSYLDFPNFLYLPTSFTSLPFFYMGRQMISLKIIRNEKEPKRDLILVSVCVLIAYFMLLFPDEITYNVFYLNSLYSGNYLFMYVGGLSLILITLTLCKYLRKVPYVSYVGRYSIIVLLTHRLVGNIFTRGVEHLTGMDMSTTYSHLILLAVILVSMLILIPFCRKFLPYICAQKSLLTERIAKRQLSI